MNKLSLTLRVWLLITVTATAGVYLGVAVSNKPFHPNLECVGCHLAGQGTNKTNASQLTSSQQALCGQCHRGALELSHPSGFTPTRPISRDYPLDWKGDMSCSTCHNVHEGKPGLMRGNLTGKAFCLSCHEQQFFTGMADRGVSIQRRGHLAVADNPVMRDLDAYSIQCLECHMERGEGPQVSLDQRGVLRHSSGSVNHPIGINYHKVASRGLYRPASQLKAGIKLPDGKLSCVSCHTGYSQKHGALVVKNDRSALCLECHNI